MSIKELIQKVKNKIDKVLDSSKDEKVREEMLRDHNKQLKEKFVDDTGREKN
jgi:hypothetical protein